jgi:predicted acylesterase/phospholipase RssA
MMPFRAFGSIAVVSAALLLLGACAGPTVEGLRDPVPESLLSTAAVPGYSHIRFWGDDAAGINAATVQEVAAQQKASGNMSPNRYYLSVSGGGSNGAFGAGVLFGWTAAGTRPEFTVVTGISTGSLIAPFAFLGPPYDSELKAAYTEISGKDIYKKKDRNRPEFTVVTGISTGSLIAPFAFLGPPYDSELKAAYTEISGKDIYKKKGVLSIIGSDSAADNSPLRTLVARYVTDTMLTDIAREHAKGRRLLIGTTNIDAERPVIWDIGAIASSQEPGRKQLIQDILVASASIPGVFSPVRIKVIADGKQYDEMHVDGGTSNQAFLFPSQFSVRDQDKKFDLKRTRTLYVVRNGKVTPEYSVVKPKLASIVGKAVGSLIKTQGIGDLYRMYANAQRDHIAFNAIWIPESFTMKEPAPFDPAYMEAVFDLGYKMGVQGIPWAKQPP